MGRQSRGVLAAAVALGVVLAAGLWALVLATSGPVRRLPDGSVLTLEGVTYGKVHPWTHGTWWQRRLYPLLSPSVRNWSVLWGPQTGWTDGSYFSRTANALVLHAFRRGGPRGYQPLHAVACDDRGQELASPWEAEGLYFRLPAGTEEGWELAAFPRRESSVRVRVYEQVPGSRIMPVAEFVVPNPAPGAFPVWKPLPLPMTKQAGDLSVTLIRMATGTPPGRLLQRVGPGEDAWTRALFRIEQGGRAMTAWHPVAAALSDATGNVWEHRNERPTLQDGVVGLQFSGALPSTEAAWKLWVELSRRAGLTPADLWSARDLPLPQRDQRIDPAATAHRQGAQLRLSLAGPGDPYGFGRGWRQPFATIQVTVSPPSPGLRLTLLAARDNQGRPLDVFGGSAAPMGSGLYRFMLARPPADAKRMNLRFAVQKDRVVEFLVAPPRE